MKTRRSRVSPSTLAVLTVLVFGLGFAGAPAAHAAEISAYAGNGNPGDTWARGYGGMLTISLFSIVHGELEGGWQGGELPGTSIVTGHAKAYIGPTIGPLVPYVGLGAGAYRESLATGSDTGTFGSVFGGVKVKFPLGIVLRGEYQRLSLPQGVLLPLDSRYFVAIGLHI